MIKEIMKLKRKPLGGNSKSKFLVKHGGKKYVLRICGSSNEANRLASLYNGLGKNKFIPKLYEKDGKVLLIEYIPGRDCKKSDAGKLADQIGKMCAIVNNMNSDKKPKIRKRFDLSLSTLKRNKVFGSHELKKLEKVYSKLESKSNIGMDLTDVNPENFRIYKDRAYLVDLHAVKSDLKGRGIAKGFTRWFKTIEQQKNFKKSYGRVRSAKFLNTKHYTFCMLVFLVQSIGVKLREKRGLQKEDVARLRKLMEEAV